MMTNLAYFKFAPIENPTGAKWRKVAQKNRAPMQKIPIVNIDWRNAPLEPICIGALMAHFAGAINVYDEIGIAAKRSL
jgi:hypothetical protein